MSRTIRGWLAQRLSWLAGRLIGVSAIELRTAQAEAERDAKGETPEPTFRRMVASISPKDMTHTLDELLSKLTEPGETVVISRRAAEASVGFILAFGAMMAEKGGAEAKVQTH
jgi:hypothetical protein